MPNRWTSDPIDLPAEAAREARRIDLVFDGVDHSGASFEARVFIDNPQATARTPAEPAEGYAGSFHIFGHGGCYGDLGHCDIPAGPAHAFDLRGAHPLRPQRKAVILDDAVRELLARPGRRRARITVTVVAHPIDSPGMLAGTDDVLAFDRVTVATYA